jgi:type 1 glutamine amidotransferase
MGDLQANGSDSIANRGLPIDRVEAVSPVRAAIVPLLLLAACGAPSSTDEAPASAASAVPLRVLVLSGGAYHEFGPNLALLVEGLQLPDGVHWTFLPLGDIDPDGVPVGLRRRRLETLDLQAEVDVVLAYTQGDLGLSERAKERLLAYVRGGGGFVGLHCAADSHPAWAEYTRMLGGRFSSHPPYGPMVVRADGPEHALTAGLPAEWALEDEFYHLKDLHLGEATVLMSATSPIDGQRKPVTWVKAYGEGRVAYTILGHGAATHRDARYRRLVGQALEWAAGD